MDPTALENPVSGCGESAHWELTACEEPDELNTMSRRTIPSAATPADVSASGPMSQTMTLVKATPHYKDSSISKRLVQYLQTYPEPFGIQNQKMRNYNSLLGSLCCSFGPTIFRKWRESGEEPFDLFPNWSAFGLRLTIRSPILYLQTLKLEIFIQRYTYKHQSASIRCSISFPAIIPKDSQVMKLARSGDVDSIATMFEAGRAGYTDTTPKGTSLLHVRQLRPNELGELTDAVQVAARETHVNLVSYLIECGADPNATNDDGE